MFRHRPLWRRIKVDDQRGSAVAEFVMVSALIIAVFLGILQLAFALHVRNTLMDAAASGARYGTLADRGPADGVQRTRELIRGALSDGFASNVQATSISVGGTPGVRITVRAAVPVFGMVPFVGEFVVHGESVRYG
ncbi:TadE/TadG family type IV pilus assembly protein [Paeniglutamicibacter gangotriensis]|uniref:TadE-like protein n=2 Tax=Paeniglutamicibacter gangotriensis TaxID=254787 RepID=M7N8L7_9MICC|nr:TadE family protein [Paeniglutamicibacter gangotriensis]EMQ98124.1 TadE-like protein [Paeniglutamicibacter gangotriensis Lz1y]KAA0979628.1 pilus assembly protein [Paeniglutamicibacter gangotriensis]